MKHIPFKYQLHFTHSHFVDYKSNLTLELGHHQYSVLIKGQGHVGLADLFNFDC